MTTSSSKIETAIIEKAKAMGATKAGIASIAALQASPSYAAYDKRPFYPEYKGVEWKEEYKSVVVLALVHPPSRPILDWWSMKIPGWTPGNRVLRDLSKKLRIWVEAEFGIKGLSLPYQVEYGGAFLKDSAALAGLGVIGKNNLLITPEYGPRVRLRGLSLEAELEPTGPIDYDPCKSCDRPCQHSCPRNAFRSGTYERTYCKEEQDERDANFEVLAGSIMGIDEPSNVVKYCRNCELFCPVAQDSVA